MSTRDSAPELPSAKKPRKIIQPTSQASSESTDEVSDDVVNEVNESIKALDPSLKSSDIISVEDDGKPMPILIPADESGQTKTEDSEESDEEFVEPQESKVDESEENLEPADDPKRANEAEDDNNILEDDENEEPISDELTEPLEDESKIEPEKLSEKEISKPEAKSDDEEDTIPDDPVIDKAVKEIIAEESDVVLAAEDRKKRAIAGENKTKNKSRFHEKIASLWTKPLTRWSIIGGSLAVILLVSLIPQTRYLALNAAGVRSKVQLTVIDQGTLQPLKNVSIRAGGASSQTNEDGVANLEGVRLGSTELKIEKRAFEPITKQVTVGWGSNPMGEFEAKAVGTQYTVLVKDYLSGEPIAKAQASSGEGNASSDEEGNLIITLDTAELEDSDQINIDISADNYRTETLNITVNNKETQSVKMVPSRKHVFVSKRSGKYDVYTAYIDGKGEDKVVGASGLERDDIALVPHQSKDVAAFVSTRENARNASGYLLSTLYIIETDTGEITKIDQSEKIQIIGWSKAGRLVYVKIAAGASGTDPDRHRIMSFDSDDYSAFKELASSNSFNDIIMADEKVYYAPSNVFQENPEPGLYIINTDGEGKQKKLDKEVFTILRTSYSDMYLSIGKTWYKYAIGSPENPEPSDPPLTQDSRIYIDNPVSNTSAWIDSRDGQGLLINYNKDENKDSTLVTRGGIKYPTYWLNEKYLVYRLSDGVETADYIISTDGGEAKKIIDVTNTSGISRWYYY